MTGLSLATKGKICKRSVEQISAPVGGGIIYRDRYKKTKPTKEECELLYFPKIDTSLVDIIKGEDRKFTVVVINVRELTE